MHINADLHVHSLFSADGKDTITDMCLSAVRKGLKHICFTEHLDFNRIDKGCGYFNYEKYSKAVDKARKKFEGRINILKGVELSEPHLYPAELEKLQKLDFDMILAAVHNIGNHFVGEDDLVRLYSAEQIYEMYYIELLKTVETGGFDVIAHFDFPKRYLKEKFNPGTINEILDKMAKNNIVLEINTSSLRRGLIESTPGAGILDLYISSGGNKITAGSDSHNKNDIGSDFQYIEGLIQNKPFIKIGYFEKRKFKTGL